MTDQDAVGSGRWIGSRLGAHIATVQKEMGGRFLKGHENDYHDAEAIAKAVQRPTMHFIPIKTPEQMDLLALDRVPSRLVSQRRGVIRPHGLELQIAATCAANIREIP